MTDPETPTARALLEDPAILGRFPDDVNGIPGRGNLQWLRQHLVAIEAEARRADRPEARVAEGLTVEALAKALHTTGLNTIGKTAGSHGKFTDRCICNSDAAAILANLPAPRPPEPDRTAALLRLVERTAAMGFCSQTHHEHLMRDAQNTLAHTPEPAPVADGLCENCTHRAHGDSGCQYENDGWTCACRFTPTPPTGADGHALTNDCIGGGCPDCATPLEACTGTTPECPHTECPDGWHDTDATGPCSCTPDCAR